MTAAMGAATGWWARHPRTGFLVRRLARLVASFVAILALTFAMIHLIPGDPVRAVLGPHAPESVVDAMRHQLWLDRPLPVQFAHYVQGVFTGNLGTSLTYNLPVSQLIAERLPNSVRLAGLAFLVIMVLGLLIGMTAAVLTRDGKRRWFELFFTTGSGLFAIVPEFLLGVGLVYVFAVSLHLLPVAFQAGPSSYVLPVAALAIGPTAGLSRIVRVEMLKVLGEDYMRTARAKRLPARLVYLRHALPNMLTATLTIGGLLLSGLVGGTVLVETVFSWQGIGMTLVDSVVDQDYSLAQASLLVLASIVLVVNLAVDLLLGFLDPRSTIREA